MHVCTQRCRACYVCWINSHSAVHGAWNAVDLEMSGTLPIHEDTREAKPLDWLPALDIAHY